MTIDPTGRDAPEPQGAEQDQEDAAEHLAATLDDERQRPAQDDQRARAESQQQGVADGESHRDAERARAPQRRRLATGANRQRGNRHQMIGAQAMEETEGEGRRGGARIGF